MQTAMKVDGYKPIFDEADVDRLIEKGWMIIERWFNSSEFKYHLTHEDKHTSVDCSPVSYKGKTVYVPDSVMHDLIDDPLWEVYHNSASSLDWMCRKCGFPVLTARISGYGQLRDLMEEMFADARAKHQEVCNGCWS